MRREQRMSALALLTLLILMLGLPSTIAYPWGKPIERMDSWGDKIEPGKVATVKGSIEITKNDHLGRLNPTRSSRQLSYYFPPRTAYRKGVIDYFAQHKNAREQTRPIVAESPSTIGGKKRTAFLKTTPELYPYETGSSLRPGSGQPTEVAVKKKPTISTSLRGEEE